MDVGGGVGVIEGVGVGVGEGVGVGVRVAVLATIVTSSLEPNAPSLAVSLNTYVPADEKVAVVTGLAVLANVTVPGPKTSLQE